MLYPDIMAMHILHFYTVHLGLHNWRESWAMASCMDGWGEGKTGMACAGCITNNLAPRLLDEMN